jgi:chromosome partitioning protein
MSFVVTVAQQKGGAGKTMLVAMLAAARAGHGFTGHGAAEHGAAGHGAAGHGAGARVAVIDSDPQASLTRWGGLRAARAGLPPITLRSLSGWRVAGEIEGLRQSHDLILIDSPPQVDTDARQAVRAADLVVVPVQPSLPDLWAAEGTLRLAIEERRKLVFLLNRAAAASRLRSRIEAEIAGRGLALLPGVLGNRTAYPVAFASGRGVTETAPKSQAAAEIEAVLAAISE